MPEVVSATALLDAEQDRHGRFALGRRRLVVGLLALVVAAAALGLLGQTTTTRSATEDGWTLRVTSSAVARAGLDVPLRIEVSRAGGLDSPVELALDADYLTLMESQGTFPEPTSARRSGDVLLLELEPPPGGGTLVVDLDVYVQADAQRGRHGSVAVADGGRLLAEVPLHTRVLP